jgi:hypothetical protein
VTVDERLRAAAADLRRVVAAAPVPPSPATERRHGSRGAVQVVTFGLALALVVGAVLATAPGWRRWVPGPADEVVQPAVEPAPEPSASTPSAPAPGTRSLTCDAELPDGGSPVDFFVRPDGMSGPVDGPAPGASPRVDGGQLVVHYLVPGGAVEVRWPPDRPAGDAGGGDSIPIDDGGPGGAVARASLATGVPGACESVEVSWWGEAPADLANAAALDRWPGGDPFARAARALYTMLTPEGTGQLVAPRAASSAGAADGSGPVPPVLPCEEAVPPVISGTSGALPPQPDPESALRAWLDSAAPTEILRSGYERVDVAADLVAFARPVDSGDGYVTVAVVTPSDDGWVVSSWEASGC